MKTLYDYIFESRDILTTSNKQRRKELEKWLKHKKYDDYVNTINQMLEDPKAAALLQDGFGGELGDTQLKFSVKEIPVSQLLPTQNAIDLDKSIKRGLQDINNLKMAFTDPILIKWPVITFRENYIIDGHHTWFQAVVFNPTGKILAFNYDGDISPIQMLKAVQGMIASVKVDKNKNNGKLPYGTISGPNIYDDSFDKNKIKKYIKENLNKDIIKDISEYIPECIDFNSTVDYITERLLDVKSNNYPENSAPDRNDMPQVFKGGTDENDKKTALPDIKGSAMNKLKDNKFIKSVVK